MDELLAQYDLDRKPTWALQDAGLDIVALCDLGGPPVPPNGPDPGAPNGTGRIAWQGTYDAYGSVVTAESPVSHAPLRAGHKGLFFDRLDAGIINPTTLLEEPRLVPIARLAGYARNRHLRAELGRWLQRDPESLAMVILGQRVVGHAISNDVGEFSLAGHYGDGPNTYSYVLSAPWGSLDPLGRFSVVDMGVAAGVAGLVSAAISGTLEKISGGSFWEGAARGYLAGYVGGAVGFGASASGLVASLWARGAIGGALGGGAAGGTDAMLARRPWQEVMANSLFGGFVGGVLGAAGGAVAQRLGVGDEILHYARGPFDASAVRSAFARVAGPNKFIGGYITPYGRVGFVEFSSSMPGHVDAVAAGLIPEGSLVFSVATNSTGRVGAIRFVSGLNLRISPEDGSLPLPMQKALADLLRGR